ncbi:hypothetical protein SELMODRAFT_87015 [Selaginella moellendorffii]|uniref:Pentacotripeptide-repeat region of PRORP domain-containing protein n=1 Tax=Selaginella moellendorffii TaxID=88036 RepID=D8R7M8_SELML|nr:hypothetical protein SELMODRAFT_87015 [Selaginella moellendorffii]
MNELNVSKLIASCNSLEDAKALHGQVVRQGLDRQLFIGTALVRMYGRLGCVEEARWIFEKMPARDAVAWTVMLWVYAHAGHLEECRRTFYKMPRQDVVATNVMIRAYAQHGCMKEAKILFGNMLEPSVMSWNSMISGYCLSGSLVEAREMFDRMPAKDVVTWTILCRSYAQHGYICEAMKLFENIPEKNVVSWNSLISAFAETGKMQYCVVLFERMPQRDIVSWSILFWAFYHYFENFENAEKVFNDMPEHDVVVTTAIMEAYARCGHLYHAISAFLEMESRGILPDSVTWIQLCGAGSLLHQSKLVANLITRNCWKHDVMVSTAVIDMHGKCSELQAAEFVFSTMPVCTTVSWNAVIAAYARNGNICKALGFFREMFLDSVPPNEVTFLVLMNSCSHRGLVPEGMNLFYSQELPSSRSMHHSCVADLSARAGWVTLDASEENIGAWTSALAAFIRQGDYMNGVDVIRRIVTLGNAKYALLISNLYALCR